VLIGDGTVEENPRDMASATVMLMLALLHDLEGARIRLASNLPTPPVPTGRFPGAQTIGLVGYGRVARRVVELLAPWNPRLLVCSRGDPGVLPPNASRASLHDLLAASDVVSLHASLDAGSRGLLDAAAVARMKPGAILVNTARGGLVDETAVARALESGRLRAAAFDCFEREPLPAASPLRGAPRTLLTPHVIGHTVEGARAMVAMFEDNVRRTLRGEPPCSLRNPEALDRLRPARSTTS
jgi:D-3-phosphoglycerate dehydrogenase